MKVYQTEQIRNIVLIGNSSSGKTTIGEAMLFEGGTITRKGDVGNKNTVSDYLDIEQNNGCSIFSSLLQTEYLAQKINILDTPGFDDFNNTIFSSFKVADMAVMSINAQNGIEVGTQIQSRYVENMAKPLTLVINQLDHDKANFEQTVEGIKSFFGNKATLVQFPVATGAGFNSLIDVLKMKMLKYSGDSGKAELLDIPAEHIAQAEELRNKLIEAAAENEESLMEKFFDKGTLEEAEIARGIKLGIAKRSLYPIFCTSAKKNYGIARLMEFIGTSCPSPIDVASPKTTEGNEIKIDSKTPLVLFVFKTSIEQHIGEINYFKVISGTLTENVDVVNNFNNTKERISQLLVVAGKTRNKIEKICAGDIGATVKLKNTKFNHTLALANNDVQIEPIHFSNPRYRTAIKAQSESDDEKLGEALNRIHIEDPTILIEYSKELKQIIISGQGEYHLNILKWHLDNIYKIATEFVAPKIPYRETITKSAQADYRHKKQSGGAGQFGEVHIVIEPYTEGMPNPTKYKFGTKEINISVRGKEELELAWGGKLIYLNCIVGGSIDARFLPAILKGIMEKMEEGPLTGSYARDIRVAVYDGKMHPVDSNEISFRLAGRNAFKEAFKNAGPRILEPIYDVEVWVPSEKMGDVMSDLQTRRAIVQGMSSEKGFEVIKAKVPLAEMSKYSTALSSITSGRAIYTMKYAEYSQVPGELQTQLLKEYEAQSKDEE
ncbi:MAG: elongation factor G [Bacteroidetes bacterium CG02_land_8_20_14_3_00_31_25]|nr:elongation factor G [Bacteroidota bacterium]PIV57749.1 MAG: elongation factor G [Bacteroidetes bacterium CG02_land_8_20_14_3_00_31_25]PIX34079.1 MAG: elongation factor G [Bacteroidetes bacterium CG_4_8_14_3_um_filter_31_14]PIY02047.1 MAG: elongation factor G [Bacteroidetes bacterium CG_4_10_14_3_um_filter_31_20]